MNPSSAAAASLLFLLTVAGATASDQAVPTFQPMACNAPGLDPSVSARLRCGVVAVPRDRADPAAGSLRLAVVIVKPSSGPGQPDPVVFLAEGPVTARAAALAAQDAAVLAPERDLILVDQRGVGRSEPRICPALAEDQVAVFAAGREEPALIAAWRQTYATCRLTMADDGIRPEWFGSQVSAEDVADVRRALGIDRLNVYALAGGTSVALSLMALHPDTLRAVVLDGVLPPDPLPMRPAQAVARALDLAIDACGRDTSCARAHPNLAIAYTEAERALAAERLGLPDVKVGQAAFVLRPPVFRLAVERLLASRQGLAVLPSFIDAVRKRDEAKVQPVLSELMRRYAAQPLGAMAAVGCRERPSWREPGAGDAPVGAFVPGQCTIWSPSGPPPLVPKNTPVPSLLLAGALDPVASPAFATQAAEVIGRAATVVTFPHVSRGAALATTCGAAIMAAFIRDPGRPVDRQCTAWIAPISFQ